MDAHTLNAWTRFALQKGGIGTCTALIDNPATDFEDLMFMSGEKIIVLRRLDESGNDSSGSGSENRKSVNGSESNSWFLGYCEGVVGRFKGSHVEIHGKLKKPVLMRRSGVGSIRDSTTQPMSKADAASMHVSQVPLGIPIAAVDSDGEEGESADVTSTPSGSIANEGQRRMSSTSSKDRDTTPQRILPSSSAPTKKEQSNRLGVSTPPLSDDSHARRERKASEEHSDSDDSDTQLPWARNSLSSTKSSRVASTDYTHETTNTQGGSTSAMDQKVAQLQRQASHSYLPPSPISSAESPIHARGHQMPVPNDARPRDANGMPTIPRIRAPGAGHTSNQSSIATTATSTSESEEDAQRRDQTFSIYDVYGRDSVAFPNFDFRNINTRSGRLTSAKSSDSLSVKSNSPLLQSVAMRGRPAMQTAPRPPVVEETKVIPAALRSPSGRRPTAPPALPSMASSIRRKVEASNAATSPASSPITSPVIASPSVDTNASHFGSFDPRRRPSMGTRLAGRPSLPEINTARQFPSPDLSSMPRSPISPASFSAAAAAQPTPLGSNLLARRMQEASLGNSNNKVGPATLHVDVAAPTPTTSLASPRGDPSSDSIRSPGHRPMVRSEDTISQSSPTFRPIRSSSDQSSSNGNGGRIGSGQLKKNPSNPQPGPHGGLTGLVAPNPSFANNGGLSTPTGSSRSPSPLSFPSPSSRGSDRSPIPQSASPIGNNRASPIGRMPNSPIGPPSTGIHGPRVLSGAGSYQGYRGVNPATVQFDSLGFIVGSGLSLPMPTEDAEEVEKWRQVLSENDLIGARKSRKIKKMVQHGIPHSMRKEVWPYLANSSVRRRAGLFEELCKTSQSSKGKKGKEIYYDAIDKDLDRAFPDHRLFMGESSSGRADLEAILKAYVHYNPIIGYTQGMSLVAGFFLIVMPAEEAFWMLCALLRDVHLEGYYSQTMKQLHVDGIVFGQLLQTMDSELATRLTDLRIEPINFTPNWFLPLFTRIVPWQTLLRLWDVFLYEGPTFVLRTALAIIRIIRDPLMDRRVCPEGGEALRLLLHPPQQLLTPENVIPCALSVKLKDGDMRKLSRQASKVVRTTFTQGRGLPTSAGPPQKRN